MKKLGLLFAAGLLLAATACTSDDEPNSPTNGELSVLNFEGEEADANQAVNEFSFKFFNQVAATWDNLGADYETASASPISAAMLMSMLANSVDDETRSDIVNALGYSDVEVVNSVCHQLLKYLPNKKHRVVMTLSNSVWYDQQYSINSDYAKHMNQVFDAVVKKTNFQTEQGAKDVNAWVSDATNGMIDGILSDGAHNDIAAILANALYFCGEWGYKFDKSKTTNEAFHGLRGEQQAKMMHQTLETSYASDDKFEMVRMSFKSPSPYNMRLLLPKEGVDIREASQALTYDEWLSLKNDAQYALATLHLPRFKTQSDFSLKGIFAAMGINVAGADFSTMGLSEAFISDIRQSTASQVDEDGAKLAAVTYTIMDAANMLEPSIIVELTFDRPFLYVVENEETGTIIMAGRVANL